MNSSRFLVRLFVFLAASTAFAAPRNLPDALAAYRSLEVGEPRSVENVTIRHDNLRLTLASGTAAEVFAGGEVVGIYFKGQGTAEYRSTDPVEQPIAAFNVRKNTKLSTQKNAGELKISETLHEVFYWAPGDNLPTLGGQPAASLSDDFAKHRAFFDRAQTSPAMHQFLAGSLTGRTARGVRAEIVGEKENLIYVSDPLLANAESLITAEQPGRDYGKLRQYLLSSTLSDRPLGRTRSEIPQPLFQLTAIDYTLTASEGSDLTLSVTETIKPMVSERFLHFYLTNEQFADIDREPRKLRVQKITGPDGAALPFFHAHNELLVGLTTAIVPGQPFNLRFDLAGDLLVRPGGDNYWILGTTEWFPQPPTLAGQFYTVHSTVKVKKPFVPIAPGITLRRETEGDYNVVESRIDKPVQFAVVLAGKYSFEESSRNGITVRIASYAGKNAMASKALTDLAFSIIDYYNYFLGEFPFPEFNIVQVNSFGFGQAPPSMMFITNEAFNPVLGETNRLYSRGINERFAHEIAHQYWGHVVKMPSFEEQWITESFAEYSAALYLKKHGRKGMYENLLQTWKSRAKQATDVSPIPLANRVNLPQDPYTEWALRTGLIYDKGAYLLWKLHQELGDQTFLTFLKSYQRSFQWKFGTTRDVAGLLKFITKKDYDPFFQKYYWGTEFPN